MKPKWLNRNLLTNPYYFTVCTTKKSFNKELKKLDLKKHLRPSFLKTPQSHATLHYFESSAGKLCAVMCMPPSDRELVELHGLILHEAVHLWQAAREYIGETHPSAELEAYAIQIIAQEMMWEYQRQTKKAKK